MGSLNVHKLDDSTAEGFIDGKGNKTFRTQREFDSKVESQAKQN